MKIGNLGKNLMTEHEKKLIEAGNSLEFTLETSYNAMNILGSWWSIDDLHLPKKKKMISVFPKGKSYDDLRDSFGRRND